jgi:AcrR family transcriptional regulator
LDVALAILEELGWDGLNARAVAERAGVSVPAVYAYFADKYAIAHELFMRYERERIEVMAPVLRVAAGHGNWQEALRTSLTASAEMREKVRGGVALSRVVAAVPELRRLDDEGNARRVAGLAELLRSWEPLVSAAEAERAAMFVVFGTRPLVDAARRTGHLDREFIDEAVRMAVLYVGDLFERARARAGHGRAEPQQAPEGCAG